MRRSVAFAAAGFSLLSAIPAVLGIRLPFQTRDTQTGVHTTRLNFTNNADPYKFGVVNYKGDSRTLYFTIIYVDGKEFAVNMDTGSSDLWLDTSNVTWTDKVENTNVTARMAYGDGTVAEGDILLGQVKMGEFIVDGQAFVSAPGTNATANGEQGLLGLSFAGLSSIYGKLNNTNYNGNPLLQNIFSRYPDEPNFITFQLNRSIFGVTDGGMFTIGEVDESHSWIETQPELKVLSVSDRWLVPLDQISVNGKNYSGHGKLDNSSKVPPEGFAGKNIALLDTGAALTKAPKYFVDALYKDIEGSAFLKGAGMYAVDCDTKLNVSLYFGNVEYPLNPLDLTTVVGRGDDNETMLCAGTFSYVSELSGADWTIGDNGLRNLVSLFNFGNLTDPNDAGPFVQLLSTTDKDRAWSEFDAANKARIEAFTSYVLKAQNTTNSTSTTGNHTCINTCCSAPMSAKDFAAFENTAKNLNMDPLMRNTNAIIGLLVVILLLQIMSMVLTVVRANNERKYSPLRMGGNQPPQFKEMKGEYETPYDS